MTDSYVQVAPNSTGAKIAVAEVTRDDGTTVVEIQEVLTRAQVGDSPPSYLDGQLQPLSVNSEGRLRVSTMPAPNNLNFFADFSSVGTGNNPWAMNNNPWSL